MAAALVGIMIVLFALVFKQAHYPPAEPEPSARLTVLFREDPIRQETMEKGCGGNPCFNARPVISPSGDKIVFEWSEGWSIEKERAGLECGLGSAKVETDYWGKIDASSGLKISGTRLALYRGLSDLRTKYGFPEAIESAENVIEPLIKMEGMTPLTSAQAWKLINQGYEELGVTWNGSGLRGVLLASNIPETEKFKEAEVDPASSYYLQVLKGIHGPVDYHGVDSSAVNPAIGTLWLTDMATDYLRNRASEKDLSLLSSFLPFRNYFLLECTAYGSVVESESYLSLYLKNVAGTTVLPRALTGLIVRFESSRRDKPVIWALNDASIGKGFLGEILPPCSSPTNEMYLDNYCEVRFPLD